MAEPLKVTFLGTGAMLPTAQRGTSGVFLNYKGEGILFDCGEGTQRQFRIAKISPTKITRICMSHWHGDHSLGLPGMIQTLGALGYSKKLFIYGPGGFEKFLSELCSAARLEFRINFEVKELGEGVFLKTKDFLLESLPMRHNAPCAGYSFIESSKRKIIVEKAKSLGIPSGPLLGKLQRGESVKVKGRLISPEEVSVLVKGRKVAFITDTTSNKNAVRLAENADLAIIEGTFSSELAEKAKDYWHLTAKEAGEMAEKARVKRLVLTHFSARYKNVERLVKEAQSVFSGEVMAARDFLTIDVPKEQEEVF